MKFATVAFALFSVILGAQSNVIYDSRLLGLNLNGLGLGLNPLGLAPVGLGLNSLGLGLGGINSQGFNSFWNNIWRPRSDLSGLSGVAYGLPGQSLSQGPAGAVDISGYAPAASYVARTRGAVHTAPLPGHIQSAASVNIAPAPGTL